MRRFIVGTDWWTDCDDVIAVRMLARAAMRGEIEILGIGLNGCMEHSAASLEGFLKYEGIGEIPIGIDLAANDFGGRPPYQARLSKLGSMKNEDAEDAVRLYRRLLEKAEGKVEIIEIGYPQVLANALLSGADDISLMSGMELFREKVERVWMMAGKWDEEEGRENNFARNDRARRAAHAFCEKCPVPVTFLGWEIGADVITGKFLTENDPLHRALADHGSAKGRSSWDPMLIQLALAGDAGGAGYDTVKGHAQVNAETGRNRFERDDNGLHEYVVRKHEAAWYEEIIEGMIESEEGGTCDVGGRKEVS